MATSAELAIKQMRQILNDAIGDDLPESPFNESQNPMYQTTSTGTTGTGSGGIASGGIASGGSTAGAGTSNTATGATTTSDGAGTTGGAPVPETDDGMANLTGWAGDQNFNPTELEHIYNNPQAILPYIFANMAPGSPGYARLRNLEWDPLAMLTLTHGAGGMLGDANAHGGVGGYANFLNEMYNQIATAGGQGFNAVELLRNIFAQTGTGTGDSQTALGNMLGAGDSTQQSRTLFNLVRDITEAGMNPLAGQAMQAAVMNQLDRYNSGVLTNDSENVPSAVDWINANAPWLSNL